MVSKRATRRAAIWKLLQDYKLIQGCCNCGYRDHPVALHFHHLVDKKSNVSDLVRSDYALTTIMKEVSKCIVMCSNCHAVETHTLRNIK